MHDCSEIVVILDRSGSMQAAKTDHEGGLQSFVQDQKELPGDVRFTLIQFDSDNPCEVIYDRTPIADVKEITLTPRGGTPLLDAIGLSVSHVEQQLKDANPDQIVVMIITDGEENSSLEWTRERVKARIAELEAKSWKFLYLGANVDAFSEAGGIGIRAAAATPYNASNSPAMYAVMSGKMLSNRTRAQEIKTSGGIVHADSDLDYDFTDAERAQASSPKESK